MGAGLFSLEKMNLSWDHINPSKYFKENDVRRFSVVPSEETSSNGQKMKHPSPQHEEEQFHIESGRAMEQAAQWGRGVSSGNIPNPPAVVCHSCVTCFRQWDWMMSTGPFQP